MNLRRAVTTLQELRLWTDAHNELVWQVREMDPWDDERCDELERNMYLLRLHLDFVRQRRPQPPPRRASRTFLSRNQPKQQQQRGTKTTLAELLLQQQQEEEEEEKGEKQEGEEKAKQEERQERERMTTIEELNRMEDVLLGETHNKWVPRNSSCNSQLKRFFDDLQKVFWISTDVQYSNDAETWLELDEAEQHVLRHVFAFFVISDGLIVDNISVNFMDDVTNPEVRQFYALQEGNEAVHARVYNDIIDIVFTDEREKQQVFDAVNGVPGIRAKCDFVRSWMDPARQPFVERLLAFAAVEGIFFQGGFLVIMWLRSRKKTRMALKGVHTATDWIMRDENLHCMFACYLLRSLVKRKLTQHEAVRIVDAAVQVELSFFEGAMPLSVFDLPLDDVKRYVQFCADRLLQYIGLRAHYHADNPFDFMRLNDLDGHINFFEMQQTYVKSGSGDFTPNDDF